MRTSKCRRARKVRYRTLLDAKIALAETHMSKSSRREERRIYRCPYCKGWHLTSERLMNPRKGASDGRSDKT